jgi:hypothetical protein
MVDLMACHFVVSPLGLGSLPRITRVSLRRITRGFLRRVIGEDLINDAV